MHEITRVLTGERIDALRQSAENPHDPPTYGVAISVARLTTLNHLNDPTPDPLLERIGKLRVVADRYDDVIAILEEAAKAGGIGGQLAKGLLRDIESAPSATDPKRAAPEPVDWTGSAAFKPVRHRPVFGGGKLSEAEIEDLRQDRAGEGVRFVWRLKADRYQLVDRRTGLVASRKFKNAREAAREARRRNAIAAQS